MSDESTETSEAASVADSQIGTDEVSDADLEDLAGGVMRTGRPFDYPPDAMHTMDL